MSSRSHHRPPRGGVALALILSACSAAQAPPPEPPPSQRSPSHARESGPEPVAPDAVELAAQPYHGVRLSDATALSASGFMTELSRFDAICFGEEHPEVTHHWAQLATFQELLDRAQTSGRALGLGMEMIERRHQKVVDRFMAGELNQQQLLREVEWDSRWRYHYNLYRPLVEVAREHGLPLLALKADDEVTSRVAESGLAGLEERPRDELPDLDLTDSEHRRWFEAATREHPHTGAPDDLYAAQVIWDETMADTASEYLKAHQPARQLLIVAGAGHCRTSAVPRRILRRLSGVRVASVTVTDANGEVPEQARAGFDYAFAVGRED